MRPVSQRFLATLAGSHTMAARARVVAPGQTGVNPAGTLVPILDGDVQLDGGADVRATLELTVDGAGLWPGDSDSLLTPYGAEVFVERGVAYGGGSVEWVSLGYFRIGDVDQDDAPDGPIRISGKDRMQNVIDAKLTSIVQFPATAQYGAVVAQLVVDAYATAVIEWDDLDVAGDPIGRAALVDSDRYRFVNELITGLGKVWYFDHRGILVIRSPPSASEPVWAVSRGAGGVLVSASRSLSRDGVYNGVLATGEALDTEAPARGLAVDSDPASPTFWGGPFGKVPREYASPLLTTDGQARLAAATILRRSLGLPYNLDLTAVPNPALEPDDPIAVGVAGTPRPNPPVQLVGDSFSRTVVDGVGTSESGHAWAPIGGDPDDRQVNGGVLKSGLKAANTISYMLNTTAAGRVDGEAWVDVLVPAAAAGAALVAAVMARYSAANEYMTLRLEFNPAGTTSLKIGRHSTIYGYHEDVLVGFDTYTPATWWRIKARAVGDLYQVKAWCLDTDVEPRDWQLAKDDDKQAGVRWGLYFWRVAGNTNTVSPQWHVDNWRTFTAPRELLTGGEVHVIDTLSIPLTAGTAMAAGTREQSLVAIGVS